jgi:hypothetical protein
MSISLIRVSRARRGETHGRPELVTFDTSDLERVLTRCHTTLGAHEVDDVLEAAKLIPSRTSAEIVLLPGGGVRLQMGDRGGAAPAHESMATTR